MLQRNLVKSNISNKKVNVSAYSPNSNRLSHYISNQRNLNLEKHPIMNKSNSTNIIGSSSLSVHYGNNSFHNRNEGVPILKNDNLNNIVISSNINQYNLNKTKPIYYRNNINNQFNNQQIINKSYNKLPPIMNPYHNSNNVISDLSLLCSINELKSDILFQSKGELLKFTKDLGRRRKNLNIFRELMLNRIENVEYKQNR